MKKRVIQTVTIGVLVGILIGAVKINAAGADTQLLEEYKAYCEEIGRAYSICPELLMAVIEFESSGNSDAVGEAGEIGLMQIYPKYHTVRAHHLKVYNLFDAYGNILTGADYLAELFVEYGDVGTVLMVYNGTSDAVERGARGDYTEYAIGIMKRTEQLERLHGK